MSGIGGLDVSYGARFQIVRTNVAVTEINTTSLTDVQMKSIHDLLHMGLSHTILKPDFVIPIAASTGGTSAYTAGGYSAAFEVDTTGNGSADSELYANGPLLRNLQQVPLGVGSMSSGSLGTGTAQSAALGDSAESGSSIATTTGGNLVLEAVLNVGAATLSGSVGTAAGFSAFGVDDDTGGSNANDLTAEVDLGADSPSGIYGAALAQAVSNLEDASDYDVAGQPEGQVSTLNLAGIGTALAGSLTGVNTGGNLATLLSNHAQNGRSKAGSTTATDPTFTNAISATSTASTLGAATGIISVISVAKVL
jgi:hypothetical protein